MFNRPVMRIIPPSQTPPTNTSTQSSSSSSHNSSPSSPTIYSPGSPSKNPYLPFSMAFSTPTSSSSSSSSPQKMRPAFKPSLSNSSMRPISLPSMSPIFYILVSLLSVLIFLNCTSTLSSHSTNKIQSIKSDPSQTMQSSRPTSRLPNDRVHSSLISQHLSHISFHSGNVKDALLNLVCSHRGKKSDECPVVVVGVSFGGEVLRFAKNGHRVFAVEAMEEPATRVQRIADSRKLDVHMFRAAATDQHGEHYVEIVYNGKIEKAPAKRVDDLMPTDIYPGVLSVDIQGFELQAVRGMPNLMDKAGSIWVEVLACNEKNKALLKTLSQKFYLFDMVPWGRGKNVKDGRMDVLESFPDMIDRRDSINGWVDWFCETRRKDFVWMQTDVVGIEKSLIDGENGEQFLEDLDKIWNEGCQQGGCRLRELKI